MVNALVTRNVDGKISSTVEEVDIRSTEEMPILVRVEYSSMNYKDALVQTGQGNLVKAYPHVGGIDLAGTVVSGGGDEFPDGCGVIVTGWRVGELFWGGYATHAAVKKEWLVRLPEGMTARQAMTAGTAGFTAMLSVMTLEERGGLQPSDGPVLVTGATGGVGSYAMNILASVGYEVTAVTNKAQSHEYLRSLGARSILPREEFDPDPKRPLAKEVWAACVDSVGGNTLGNVLSQIKYGGSVAAVGLAGGSGLTTTVIPFIIRGVQLLGIDSVMCPTDRRSAVWNRLADFEKAKGPIDVQEIDLASISEAARRILAGEISGRLLVRLDR